jgi:LysM repeat protein
MATEIYKVKTGESLSIISRNVLGDMERWPEIAFLNGLRHPYFIYPGQILELPPESGGDIIEVVSTAVAPVTLKAGFTFSPATVFLLVIGATLLFFNKR